MLQKIQINLSNIILYGYLEINDFTKKIMSKLHPDRNNDTDTTKLAQMVSEAKETILKNDFN